MSPSLTSVTAQGSFITNPTPEDPYQYQVGFGNSFASEALPGVLPAGQNNPQKNKYGLYTEQVTGNPFAATRDQNLHSSLYRMKPSVAHQGFTRLPDNPDFESCFLPLNSKVHVSPTELNWRPFKLPPDNEKVDWVEGLKTLAGNGDPTLREGLAVHVYLANSSMGKKAFCNVDGDMLILPQQGRLDIQTEFGKMMVKPGELCVIQRGIKFKVVLPDGPSRGYAQEIFGSHYVLPELGSIGGHGLANPRDFESPVASCDVDNNSPWDIIYKVAGQLHACHQGHTPFDVVAWHGNYVPYKYDLAKFVYVSSVSRDHIDPSIYCVLTAKSKQPGMPLADLIVFGERWEVADDTFRPPYYHRNSASEFLGTIFGGFGGRDGFTPGGASFDTGFCPHGMDYDFWKVASEMPLVPERVFKDSLIFMFESSMPLTMTDYAMTRCGVNIEHNPNMWDSLKNNFMDHLDQANADLKAAGRPPLGSA